MAGIVFDDVEIDLGNRGANRGHQVSYYPMPWQPMSRRQQRNARLSFHALRVAR